MTHALDFKFFDGATSEGASNGFYNNCRCDTCGLQVTGTFVGEIEFQGMIDIEKDTWDNIAVVQKSSLATKTSITAAGIYAADISVYKRIRVNIKSIESGSVNVFANFAWVGV